MLVALETCYNVARSLNLSIFGQLGCFSASTEPSGGKSAVCARSGPEARLAAGNSAVQTSGWPSLMRGLCSDIMPELLRVYAGRRVGPSGGSVGRKRHACM